MTCNPNPLRPLQSFDSQDEYAAWREDMEDAQQGAEQAADDLCSEGDVE